jgi:hypothetical protein
VSRSHVTSVEPVVNAQAKTKRYSAKRDLYGDFAYAQPLKMTALAFLLSLNISTGLAATCAWKEGSTTELIISGTLEISNCPTEYASTVEKVTFAEGSNVTSLGPSIFRDTTNLTSITLPDTLTNIENKAFQGATGLTSITIPDSINTENWDTKAFRNLPATANIICQGGTDNCYKALSKFFSAGDKHCPTGITCNCSSNCIDSSLIVKSTSPSQCSGNYGWSGAGCSRKNTDGSVDCASGFVEWENQCLDEYPFAKKRWTPAEANQWLHDGNDNFVVITFKK